LHKEERELEREVIRRREEGERDRPPLGEGQKKVMSCTQLVYT
jgi:hypothetical protein